MTDLRPVRVAGSAVALVVLAVAFMGVARTTGSGWLLVLLSLVAGVVVAGVVLPALGLRRLDLAVSGPRDAMVGRPLPLTVDVRRGAGVRLRVLAREGDEVRVDSPGAGVLDVVPGRRGLLRSFTVEARTAAPLGLVTWRRRVHVVLPTPVEVAPAPIPTRRPLPRRAGVVGVDNTGQRAADDAAVRSVREYSPGDPLRLVHWPATAKTGEVMVRHWRRPRRRASPSSSTSATARTPRAGPPDWRSMPCATASRSCCSRLRRTAPSSAAWPRPSRSAVAWHAPWRRPRRPPGRSPTAPMWCGCGRDARGRGGPSPGSRRDDSRAARWPRLRRHRHRAGAGMKPAIVVAGRRLARAVITAAPPDGLVSDGTDIVRVRA